MTQIQIQPGHIARHTPQGAGAQGRGAAIIDVAQDLLLRHLSEIGLADKLAFKGGTSLRKLYAGNSVEIPAGVLWRAISLQLS